MNLGTPTNQAHLGNFFPSLKLFSKKSLQDVIFDFASIFWIGNVWKPCKCEPSSAVFLGINGINSPHFRPGQTSKPLKSKVRNQAVNLFERIWPLDLNHWNMWGEKGRWRHAGELENFIGWNLGFPIKCSGCGALSLEISWNFREN